MESDEELNDLQVGPEKERQEMEANLQTIYEQQERIQQLGASLAQMEAERDGARQLETDLRGAIMGQEERLKAQDETMATLRGRLAEAVGRYRALVIAQTPEVPEELVQGESIEEVDASLVAARGMVVRIQSHLSQQARSIRVPLGAPLRSVPDLSLLSPREKIAHGLSRAG
mgnify:CR=1 FL=1